MLNRAGITSLHTVLLWSIVSMILAGSSGAVEPVVQPARDGIFDAFETHPLVGLGELHGLANGMAFNVSLVMDPRFADTVGNVVVEFGASQHQDILDRYLAGEDVTYSEISKVWRDTVAWNPTVAGIGYQTFFASVRAVNLSLPSDHRVRVWLSEPPINWSTIHTKEEWQQIYDQREYHADELITREILDRGKKALVIYSVGHFLSYPWPSTWPRPTAGTEVMGEIVERTHPGSYYVVATYAGYYQKPGCSTKLEAEMNWPKQVLISPVRDTPLEDTLMRPECMRPVEGIEPPLPAAELARLEKRFFEMETGVAGDALLYLAPAAELIPMPMDPTIWMDVDYYEELARRMQIRSGRPPPSFAEFLSIFAGQPRSLWTP